MSSSYVQWLNIGQGTLHGSETVAFLSYQITGKEKWVLADKKIKVQWWVFSIYFNFEVRKNYKKSNRETELAELNVARLKKKKFFS